MVLEQIPTNEGLQTLIACALVATWWTGPSQRLLFSSVAIYQGNYERWMNGVVRSGSKDRLLGYVRSMYHSSNPSPRTNEPVRMRHLPGSSGEYLSALYNLCSLTLRIIVVEHIREEGFRTCFSAFRETLTYLSLTAFTTAPFSAFVTLVDYFPNITTLELEPFVLRSDEGLVPSFSRPLRGKLRVCGGPADCLEPFNRFARLDLEHGELSFTSRFSVLETKFPKNVLQINISTIKFLTLARGLGRE